MIGRDHPNSSVSAEWRTHGDIIQIDQSEEDHFSPGKSLLLNERSISLIV
jgi:hypothetical protein